MHRFLSVSGWGSCVGPCPHFIYVYVFFVVDYTFEVPHAAAPGVEVRVILVGDRMDACFSPFRVVHLCVLSEGLLEATPKRSLHEPQALASSSLTFHFDPKATLLNPDRSWSLPLHRLDCCEDV